MGNLNEILKEFGGNKQTSRCISNFKYKCWKFFFMLTLPEKCYEETADEVLSSVGGHACQVLRVPNVPTSKFS